MNPHLKLAYDHGVQKALEDAGLTKLSERYNSISTDSYGEQIKGWENADESLLKNPVDGYYHAINIEKSRPWFGNALLPSEVDSFRDALRNRVLAMPTASFWSSRRGRSDRNPYWRTRLASIRVDL